jgi:hypothetical protein
MAALALLATTMSDLNASTAAFFFCYMLLASVHGASRVCLQMIWSLLQELSILNI